MSDATTHDKRFDDRVDLDTRLSGSETLRIVGRSLQFIGRVKVFFIIMVILAAAWKQVAYNFLFYLAAMQSIPRSIVEAAAIDGAGPMRRFWTIIFPLLSPTTFFLLVVNAVYAFFDTFGIIHAVTQGGPANATTILVYKVYNDGFVGLDLGGSAAQSVILMVLVISMTVVQFRFIEKRVQY